MKDLYVIHDDNTVFADYSKESKDYLRDSYSIDFVAIEDALYIGLYKPFNSVYVELETPSIVDQDFIFKVNNGTSEVSLVTDDDTKAFQRSGFIRWDRDTEWTETTVNNITAYWVKIEAPGDFTATIKGLNIVFADDLHLKAEQPNINRLIPVNEISFINYHVAARDEIIQTIRNSGEVKQKDTAAAKLENITKWDILDIGEIAQAAKYLALSKIYFDISENSDDKSYQRYKNYMGSYGKAFKLFYKSIDNNDDGVADETESLKIRSSEMVIW